MKRRYLFLVGALVLIFTLAACGGDDPTPTSSPPTPTTAAATATPTTPTPGTTVLPPTPTRAAPTATPTPAKAAWEIEWEALVAAAHAEGEVEVWASAGQDERAFYKDQFEAVYPGIKVTLFQTASSSARDNRFLEERAAGVSTTDVFLSGGGSPSRRLSGTAREIVPLFILPELAPEFWENGYRFSLPDEKYFFESTSTTAPAMVVHKSVDVSKLTKWEDLFDPQFKDKIVMQDPRKSGGGYGRGLFLHYVDGFGPEFAARWYGETGVTFNQDQRQIAEWVATGKMLIGINFEVAVALQLIEEGTGIQFIKSLIAPNGRRVESVSSSPGVTFIPDTDLPHPAAAQLYLNWYLSKDGAQRMMNTMDVQSRRTDVDPSVLPVSIRKEPGAEYESMTPLATKELTDAMRGHVVASLP